MVIFQVDFLVDFFFPWFCCGDGFVVLEGGFFRFFGVFFGWLDFLEWGGLVCFSPIAIISKNAL